MGISSTTKGTDRRDQIIDACTRIIVKHGVGDFTFELLAKALKTSRPHIRYYFPSKRELFLACFEKVSLRGQTETRLKLEDAHTWQDRLVAMVEGTFSWHRKYPEDMTILFIFYHYASLEPKLAMAHAQTREVGRKRIESIMLAGLSKHMTKQEASERSSEFQNMLTGLMVDAATTLPDRSNKHLKSALASVQRMIKEFGS